MQINALKIQIVEYNARISDNRLLWKDGAIYYAHYLQIKANYLSKIKQAKKQIQAIVYKNKREAVNRARFSDNIH